MKEVDAEGLAIRPNKSQLKREHAAARKLVEALLEAGEPAWAALSLEAAFCRELALARDMKASGARNRQIKFLVRQLQAEGLERVRDWLENRPLRQADERRRLHRLEQWRARLVEEGDAALGDFLGAYPQTDRQQLRQLIRNAARERQCGKPSGAGRKLFRWLREHVPD